MTLSGAQARSRLLNYVLDGTPSDIVGRYASLYEISKNSNFGALDENIVVLDTETTGFSFTHDELTQIAAARMSHGEIVDWYVTFVNPGKPIPDDVVHLTNIHDEDVADAPTPEEALAGLVEFVGNAIVIAHNVDFDRTFTTRHETGLPLLENRWFDSLDLSRIALPRLKSHRLIDIVKAFDAPLSTHRADADVAATCVAYRILLAGVAAMPSTLIAKIASLAPESDWRTAPVFQYFDYAIKNNQLIKGADGSVDLSCAPCDIAVAVEFAADHAPDAFSLYTMRKARIAQLPQRKAKRDADLIAGDPTERLLYPSCEEVERAFSAEGLLGTIYENYEPRSEQLQMAQAIRKAFEKSENLVVEAGTGVGKSMGYLVPAALMAQKNNIAIGVATKTNALLDQLVFSELPALSEALAALDPEAEPLSYAALKGYSHYPCLRKINRIAEDGVHNKEVNGVETSQAAALAGLLSYIEQTEFDDIDSLKIDFRLLPRYAITTTSNDCLKRKCPYFGKLCFTHGARRRAESADILVTNHTLLFCDLAAEGGLLPTARHWIVDEAHDAEPEARRAFTQAIDDEKLLRIANRVSGESATRNLFVRAEHRVESNDESQITLFYALSAKAKTAGQEFARVTEDFVSATKGLLYYDDVKKNRSYERFDLWINQQVRSGSAFNELCACESQLVDAADKLIKASQDLVAYLDGVEEAAEIEREIASMTMDLRDIRDAAEIIFETAPENYVYQADLVRKKDRFADTLEAQLLDVGQKLNETLYARTHSVVYASATLSVNERFDSFEAAMGLNQSEFSVASGLQLDSSFDFDNNMIVYVVKDMPEPNEPSYLGKLQELLIGAHIAQGGSMLTLFTNRREMETCFDAVKPALQQKDLRLVCQKWGVSVKGLRDDFLADETLSLFALKSFWQGFDAPGSTLRGVIIPKLPFARPTDPLYCERQTRDDSAWFHYVLPQAVIETKQAAGRLIRKADDTGVLILADKRLISKRYGKQFLNSLQSKTVRVCTIAEIVQSLLLMRR